MRISLDPGTVGSAPVRTRWNVVQQPAMRVDLPPLLIAHHAHNMMKRQSSRHESGANNIMLLGLRSDSTVTVGVTRPSDSKHCLMKVVFP